MDFDDKSGRGSCFSIWNAGSTYTFAVAHKMPRWESMGDSARPEVTNQPNPPEALRGRRLMYCIVSYSWLDLKC